MRKYQHNFQEQIDIRSKEAVDSQNMPLRKCFLVSDDDYISVFCNTCFSKLMKFNVPLKLSDTMDKMEIISIKVSRCQCYLAVITGRNLIKGIEELHQVFIYLVSGRKQYDLIYQHDLD
jgi:hypothetical protein